MDVSNFKKKMNSQNTFFKLVFIFLPSTCFHSMWFCTVYFACQINARPFWPRWVLPQDSGDARKHLPYALYV